MLIAGLAEKAPTHAITSKRFSEGVFLKAGAMRASLSTVSHMMADISMMVSDWSNLAAVHCGGRVLTYGLAFPDPSYGDVTTISPTTSPNNIIIECDKQRMNFIPLAIHVLNIIKMLFELIGGEIVVTSPHELSLLTPMGSGKLLRGGRSPLATF